MENSYLALQTFKPQELPCVLEEREAQIFVWVPCWGRGKYSSAFPRISSMDINIASYNPQLTAEIASELQMILQTGASFCHTIASHRKSPLERLLRAFILMWETIIVLQASQSSRTKKLKKQKIKAQTLAMTLLDIKCFSFNLTKN